MERVMFSSNKQTWETPRDLFAILDGMFHFDLDVCADKDTAKCKRYFTEEQDGLKQDWEGVCWMNPPYNRHQHKWVKKGIEEVQKGNCKQLVVLIPARTETVAWQDYIFPNASNVMFFKGRLKFEGTDNAAPFPSALVIFGKSLTHDQKIILSTYGKVIE